MNDSADARLRALEERVAALEAEGAGTENPRQPPDDVFWVLNGIRERYPDPGVVLFAGTATTPAGEPFEYQYGLETAHLLDTEWTQFAESLAALGNPMRLAILRAVAGGIETVAGLVEELDAGTSGQIYHHVNQLVARGWLAPHSRSRYRIPPARIIPLLAILTAAAGGN
ncbi:helix-turn-helix transcriptional regulator [Arthrobacter sp. Sa2BUA2]|uniref:Helix-turn-helix transcriptional regulator n=1 Tax=Arthrobacter pullicola TaxID=2762224 RepID=A0ABR8YGI4_9MICC|nr:helix-turn-helix transcriptional regulator [Arthrobacter pullicola]MBD8043323.1 helix-turn-helix transcriptional regulator [Arthrobacter pullicola]